MEKQRLTPEIAKEYTKKVFSKFNDEERESRLWHAETVAKVALIFADKKGLDNNTLEIAGWIHDIGYIIDAKTHAEQSVKILEAEFELGGKLKDCILNHGSDSKPQTEEGKIIQLADKTCILNPEFLDSLVKYNKGKLKEEDLAWIEKMTNNAIKLLKNHDF